MRTDTLNYVILGLFVLGLLAAVAGFAVALFVTPKPWPVHDLGNAGDFVSGLTAIFGMMLASFAILVYVRAESARTKAAGQVWQAKLRLEDALHTFIVLLKTEVDSSGADSITTNSVLFGHGLHVLEDALAEARRAGLYRVLASTSMQRGDQYNIAYEFACLEAHVSHDIA